MYTQKELKEKNEILLRKKKLVNSLDDQLSNIKRYEVTDCFYESGKMIISLDGQSYLLTVEPLNENELHIAKDNIRM